MLKHHLKLAFRNLRKYKPQNIISIIGLAVGFTCFAFSALWIRYEMSYDSFHAKADRIYRVQMARLKWDTYGANAKEIQNTPYPLANYLKSNFPEIEFACGIKPRGTIENYSFLNVDSSFCDIFDLKIPKDIFAKGRTDQPVVVVEDLKGVTEFIKERFKYDVQAIIPRWPANTNIPFNILVPVTSEQDINDWLLFSASWNTYILIKEGVDVQTLEKKLDKILLPESYTPVSLVLTPLKQLRYKDPSGNIQSDIKFSHIQIFALAGLLVILCSLFNHLTLYVSRIQMRLRELALRKVNGATNWQIAATLYTDFMLVILLSLVSGFMLIAWLLTTFKEYASIGSNNINIYTEIFFYSALLLTCGFIVGGVPILYFRKQVLNDSIKGLGSTGSRNMFRKSCLLVQLIISLVLIFCAAVFFKQMYFLNHTDLGIKRHNIASVSAGWYRPLRPPYVDRIRQIPGIIDVLPVTDGFLKDFINSRSMITQDSDGKIETYTIYATVADAHFFDFFGVEIFEGTGIFNEYNRKKVINETAMIKMGDSYSNSQDITGIARDFYLTPTAKPKPTEFYFPDPRWDRFKTIAYKYEEGMRLQTQQAVTKWLREEFPDQGEFEIDFTYMEDVFEEYFKSERALLTLLSVMTLACILIAVFGVYSLTSLTCQQRRKEIAIRKVHGAEVLDIMNIFFREYLILLAMAAFMAFPAGCLIMKPWLEGYVKQTSMDAWLYVAIFLMVFVVIVVSIFSTVWRAANQNSAEVVKAD